MEDASPGVMEKVPSSGSNVLAASRLGGGLLIVRRRRADGDEIADA
jgi:hypothetical protein